MSFSGALGFSFSDVEPAAPPGPFDYLYSNGAGLALLQTVATQTADMLLSNKGGYIKAGVYVPADPLIAAVWGGHTESARLFASTMVSTMVAEARQNPSSRVQIAALVQNLVLRIMTAMRAGGDPASCLIAFESSMGSWKSLYPAVGSAATGWCKRDLVFSGSCTVLAQCAQTLDATGKPHPIPIAPPPSGQFTTPPPASASAPVPPPTHAQIDATVSQGGAQAFRQADQIAQHSEFSMYMNALLQARVWLILALGLPTTASDQAIWDALAARGIAPDEALDWFTSCDAAPDCFRERMNAALGETDEIVADNRSKALVVVGVAAAAAFAFFTWRRR